MATKSTLRFGSKGSLVQELQQNLNQVLPLEPLLKVDGIFGTKTHGRVKELQAKNGLATDGVVGPLTWNCLAGLLANLVAAAAGVATGLTLTELNPFRLAIATWAEWECKTHGAFIHAYYKGAKDDVSKRYYRQGWQYLTDYFSTAKPDYEKYWGKDVARYLPYAGHKDNLPQWCGIFALAIIKKALLPTVLGGTVGNWIPANSISSVQGSSGKSFEFIDAGPIRKGDVAFRIYRRNKDGSVDKTTKSPNHHAIVIDVQGTGKTALITTIDGNSGPGSSVTKNTAPRSSWDRFYKVKSINDL